MKQEWCTQYHCPGDCGRRHWGDLQRKRYAKLVLAAFDQQTHERAAPIREQRAQVRRKAKEQL